MTGEGGIDRRGLLLGAVGLALGAAGCTASSGGSSPQVTTTATPSSAGPTPLTSPTASSTPARSPATSHPRTSASPASWPHVSAWHPNPRDVQPAVKLQAVRVIEAIGSWGIGQDGVKAAASRVSALGQSGSLARQALPLLGGGARAAVQVIDAQYGGILAASASVLVVCRQWLSGRGGRPVAGGTTVDVRLRAHAGGWIVTALNPAHPGQALPTPSALARRVLASSRIVLPPASMADVRSGQVHESVLRALLTLAGNYRIDVSVIRSGHPTYVFGTTRLSDHPRGRAFDTWRINGHAVVDARTPRSLVVDYMRAAAATGSYNVGGPYLLAGGGNQFFSDATHHDHVHAGFST